LFPLVPVQSSVRIVGAGVARVNRSICARLCIASEISENFFQALRPAGKPIFLVLEATRTIGVEQLMALASFGPRSRGDKLAGKKFFNREGVNADAATL
jgi:hypothetical protein